MFKTLKALKSLTPQQRAVMQAKQIAGDYTPRALISSLAALAEFDEMGDKTRKVLGVWLVLCVVGLIISTILALNGFVVVWALAILLLLAIVYFGVTFRTLKHADLSNNFRQIAMPLFAILHEDMDAQEPLHLRLDLSEPNDARKKTGTSEPYASGGYHRIIDTTFVDPWFDGAAKLADGSSLHLQVTDELVESARTKRNGRGKTKTKTKYRKRSVISAEVGLPLKTYDFQNLPPEHGDKIKFQDGAKRTTIKLSKTVKSKSNEPIDAGHVVDIISEAYRRVKPAMAGGLS